MQFQPRPPFPTLTHPSLAALSPDHELRKIYPRDFFPNPQVVRLPLGETTYWLLGPQDGRKIVLVHGISIPAITFRDLAPALAERGFRVLLYDLFGRGYTDAPADPTISYDTNMYITQLALLFQHVGFEKADIVGYSMGGGIVAAFVAMFPNLVNNKLVLIASAGLMDARAYTPPSPDSFPDGKVPITALPPSFNAVLPRLQLENLPGYYRALASSIICGPLRGLHTAFEAVAARTKEDGSGVKCLIIHGNADESVPLLCGERIKGIIPHAEFVVVEGAGHDLLVSKSVGYKVFEESVLKFLSY